MSELTFLMPKILYDRADKQKMGPYELERNDMEKGFHIDILKYNKKILEIDYYGTSGNILNIDAATDELTLIIKELNSCLPNKVF